MITKNLERFRKFKCFLGKQVWRLFFVSLSLGIFLFLVESSFVFVLQGFLSAIGLVDSSKLIIPSWYPTSLKSAVILLLVFGILRAFAYMGRQYINGVTGKAFMRLQRSRIVEYAFKNIDHVESHKVIALFGERVNEASNVLQGISQIIMVGTSTILFLAMGLKLAPIEMLLGVTLLAVALVPFSISGKKIGVYGEETRLAWENANRILIMGLKHNFLYRIYGLLDIEIENANRYLRRYEDFCRYYFRATSLKSALPNLTGIFVLSFITYISIAYIHTPGIILLSFFYLFIRLAQGASELNFSLTELQMSLVGFKQMYQWHEKLLASQHKIAQKPAQLKLNPEEFLKDGVTLNYRNLSFRYEGGHTLIYQLNLEVKKGQVLLIKGESGVGKSTLLMLSIGMLEPSQGSVEINGVTVTKVSDLLFDAIAYVGPEPYMVAGTLRENLLYGHRSSQRVTDEEMKEALSGAQLNDSRLSLDLFLNEQTQLSTGQKQRIAIARAMLRKPKLLILDEATANLDAVTESNFIDSFANIFKQITTLVISHKASFDRIADQTIELKRNQG